MKRSQLDGDGIAENESNGNDMRLEMAMKELSKSIMCGICLEDIHHPITLYCSHTFCKACLDQLLQSTTAKCPYCSRLIRNSEDMSDSSIVMTPIIQSVRQLINNFFGVSTVEEDSKKLIEPIKVDKPSFASGDVVNVAPRLWPGINKPGGAAFVTAVHDNGNSYDVKYILGGGSDFQVPVAFIRNAADLQEDRSQRTRRSKVRSQSSPAPSGLSQSVRKRRRRSQEVAEVQGLSFSDDDDITQGSTSERKKRTSRGEDSKSIVFLATTLGEESHALLRAFCSEFPTCRIVTKYSDLVTHVIVTSTSEKEKNGNGPMRNVRVLRQRTMKYLQGLLGGKWIVSIDWIERCLLENKILSEESYEIDRDYKASRLSVGAPRLSRLNTLDGKTKLFEGMRFVFHGNFPSPGPTRGDLEDLLGRGGASLLSVSNLVDTINTSLDGGLKVDRSKHTSKKNQVIVSIVSSKESLDDLYSVLYSSISQLRSPLRYDFEDFIDHLDGILITLHADWVFDCISNFMILDPFHCDHRIHHAPNTALLQNS